MDSPIVGALLAFAGGAAVAWLNFRINVRTLKKNPAALSSMAVARQLLSVGYLVAVFALAGVLPWDHIPLLLGAAAGLTIPSILLSVRLARLNDSLYNSRSGETGKGADANE